MRITIIIFLLVGAKVVFAQSGDTTTYERRKLFSAYEVVLGGGLLKNAGFQMQYFKPKFGYSIGVGAYHAFTKSFELNVRLTYDLKGSSAEENSSWPPLYFGDSQLLGYTMESEFHYVTMAALPTFCIGKRKNVVLGGGFFYSVLRDVNIIEYKTLSNGYFRTQTRSSKNAKWDGGTDMGICVFAGYKFKVIKKITGTVQLFYNRSVRDIDEPMIGWQQHRSLMLMFSVSLPNR